MHKLLHVDLFYYTVLNFNSTALIFHFICIPLA
uniref:Uncharacterized protein n=1 Tax=Siphoviridae sp. ct87j35 TaxID=2825356 RepID=A0A8S5V4I3_9CAUD|nr:MAG TPA: hypothetical protein [Siphoviridae sp. ct87j35]